MRILVVSNLYPPVVFGGYEILCAQVLESLRRRGHEVHVLTSAFGKEDCNPDPEVERSLALTTPFPKPGQAVGTVDFRLRTMQQVADVNRRIASTTLESFPAEIVFLWCMNRLSLGPAFAAQERRVPVCYTINDEHPRQFRFTTKIQNLRHLARYFAERLVWPMSTFSRLKPFPMTLISQALKKSLLAQGTPVGHAEVIYQGISLESFPFRPFSRESGSPCRLLYAGQLSRVKGVHTILRALGILLRSGHLHFRLSVAGSGVPDYESELQRLSQNEGIRDKVAFLGKIPHAQIAEVYSRHHVLIFSSEWEEPFGLTHLEAMSSGCAVISTTTGGTAELIRDGRNALAFEAGNAPDLAGKLSTLLEREDYRRALAVAARRWVEQYYGFDVYVDQIEVFLQQTFEGRNFPRNWGVGASD